jgi:carboxylesterase
VALAVVLSGGALFFYSCATGRSMRAQIAAQNRDPITGVVRGTEALTILPTADIATTSRTACLLVHGFLSSRQDYADLPERLAARGITVRAMRLPGHGTTPMDFAGQPEGALLGAVRQEYRNLTRDHDRVYVVGFSMGGALATLLASEEPVTKLVLLAPYYGVTYKWYYVLPAETWQSILGPMVPYIQRPMGMTKLNKRENADRYFMYQTLTTAGTGQLMRLGRAAGRHETLARVQCPVLLIHSRNDEAASPAVAAQAFDSLGSTDKRAVWLEKSNHVICWDYDAEEVLTETVAFLAGGPGAKHVKDPKDQKDTKDEEGQERE